MILVIGLLGVLISRGTNEFAPAISGCIGALIGIGYSIYKTRNTPKRFLTYYTRYGRQNIRVDMIIVFFLLGSLSALFWHFLFAIFH